MVTHPDAGGGEVEVRTSIARGRYDLVAIAASAGGVEALATVLAGLPADFPVSVAIVQHRSANPPNLLARVLGRRTGLKVKTAEQSEMLVPGTVYLAPPDLHLTVRPDRTTALADGRRIRHVRSSANPLFSSAAEALGGRVIAVSSPAATRTPRTASSRFGHAGGVVLAQDEATAAHFAMPRSAIETGCVDRVLPLADMAPALIGLVSGAAADGNADRSASAPRAEPVVAPDARPQ